MPRSDRWSVVQRTPASYAVEVDGVVVYRAADRAAADRSYDAHVSLSEWREMKGWPGMVVKLWDAHRKRVLLEHRPAQVGEDPGRFAMLGAVAVGVDAPSITKVRDGKAVLRVGMKGGAVKYVQGLLGGVVPDGDYGTQTKKAVEAFQLQNFLRVDGAVGRETLGKLEGRGGAVASSAPASTLSSLSAPSPVLDPYPSAPVPPAKEDDRPMYGPPASHPEWLASRSRDASSAPPPSPYAPSASPMQPDASFFTAPPGHVYADPGRSYASSTVPPGGPPSTPPATPPPATAPVASGPGPMGLPALAIRSPYGPLDAPLRDDGEESWFVQDTIVPSVPNAGVVAGGVALGAGLLWLLKSLLSRGAAVATGG